MTSPEANPSSSRRWVKWVVLGVVVAAVLLIGLPYAYINVGTSDAPAPLALTNSPTTAAGGAPTTNATTASGSGSTAIAGSGAASAVDGTWKVADGSQAGYRIQETLVGQSTEAVGRTTAVTGEATIAGGSVTAADFSVDMTKVTSDKTQRDGQFQGRIMETSRFPTATFELTRPIALGTIPADGQTTTVKATGDLTLHGVTKPVTIDLTAQRDGTTIKVSGNTLITFADYDINNPSGGPASVGDSGQLEFLLVLSK